MSKLSIRKVSFIPVCTLCLWSTLTAVVICLFAFSAFIYSHGHRQPANCILPYRVLDLFVSCGRWVVFKSIFSTYTEKKSSLFDVGLLMKSKVDSARSSLKGMGVTYQQSCLSSFQSLMTLPASDENCCCIIPLTSRAT